MAIAGLATGATKGYIFTRSEYPLAIEVFNKAIEIARGAGILGHSFSAPITPSTSKCAWAPAPMSAARKPRSERTRRQARCGPRQAAAARAGRPFGKPTVVNNVISLASVPIILDEGAEYYRDFGMGRSRGTIPIQIGGNARHTGLYEIAFGLTLGEIMKGIAGGTATGRPVKAVQVGGPLGPISRRRSSTRPSTMKPLRRRTA